MDDTMMDIWPLCITAQGGTELLKKQNKTKQQQLHLLHPSGKKIGLEYKSALQQTMRGSDPNTYSEKRQA